MKTLALCVRVSFCICFLISLKAYGYKDYRTPVSSNFQPKLKTSIKISAFNIQIFGRSKSQKPEVMKQLVKILNRSDINFIQEIRDKSGSALRSLWAQTNQANAHKFALIQSEPLGRTSSKEQYAYMYNDDLVQVLEYAVYPDPYDVFEREPFMALWKSRSGEEFITIGLHAKPSDVDRELAALNDVVEYAQYRWANHSVLIMGDLNADCDYYNEDEGFSHIAADIESWILDHEDTTVGATNCSYDRFLSTGSLGEHIKEVEVFNFERVYKLSHEFSKQISDHYPIELTLDFGMAFQATDDSGKQCLQNSYQTPLDYCFGFKGKVKRRVPGYCCF